MPQNRMDLLPCRYLTAALATVAVFFVLNLIAAPYFVAPGSVVQAKLAKQFMMNQERNLPTLFNYGLVVMNALFLAMIAFGRMAESDRWRWHWAGLGLVFLVLSYDEAAQLHERLDALGALLVDKSGAFSYAWIVPALPLLGLFLLVYVRFLLNQPRSLSVMMVISGAVFLSGAIGMEMVGAADFASHGTLDRTGYHLLTGIEEALEMIGMALFGYTLLRELRPQMQMQSQEQTQTGMAARTGDRHLTPAE